MIPDNLKSRIEGQFPRVLRPVPAPEWDTTFYVYPMNLAEKSQIHVYRAAGTTKDPLRVFVQTVILLARDVDGNLIFGVDDADYLMRQADPEVVSALAANLVREQTVAELKNE